ncbi:MAG: pitrilysin family protein [Alphaproteobacteria bacterium]
MRLVSLLILMMTLLIVPAYATTIQEVESKGGIKAWLVEDHKLPLISIHFAFRGGVEQDPVEKQGLTNLTVELLTAGAGPYDASAFQQQMADYSINISFTAGRDAIYGGAKGLSKDKDKIAELLRLALTEPRFAADDIERLRNQQLAALRMQLGSSDWQSRYALFQHIFAHHPYGARRLGSTATLASLTREDIKNFATDHLARDNLTVAVAGDITPEELASFLDAIFGVVPAQAKLAVIPELTLSAEPATILVPREGTQTQLLFAMPGPKRNDPDWYAAEITNYILGGGGFASRLMHEVRDKAGLTYGIGTDLSPMDFGAVIIGEASTDNDKTAEAWKITLATMRSFYKDGATEKDINAAKDYLTGATPLAMTSTDKIAAVLVEMQLENLGRDYLDRRPTLLRQVTAEDIRRVITKWFNPDKLNLSMVGKPEGIQPTQTRELVAN